MKRQERVKDIQDTLADLEGCSRDSKGPFKRRKIDHPLEKTAALSSTLNVATKQHNAKISWDRSDIGGGQDLLINAVENTDAIPPTPIDSFSKLVATAVSCFMNSRGNPPCDRCSWWKGVLPKERRVHSLDALLTACGQGNGLVDIKQGLVFVDVNDVTVTEWTLQKVRGRANDTKVRVLVFACSVDRLSEENALLVV